MVLPSKKRKQQKKRQAAPDLDDGSEQEEVERAESGAKQGNKRQKVWGESSTKQRWARRDQEKEDIDTLERRIREEVSARGVALSAEAAKPGEEGPNLTKKRFKDMPLSKPTLAGLASCGFKRMTEIQSGAILPALAGRDILGEARTGSGKTLAFLVPMIELLYRRRWTEDDGLGGIVISPTRELAYQIYQVLTVAGSEHDLSAGCVVGGRSLQEEQQTIAGMAILVATPGRLLQHLDESQGFEAGNMQMLVLDEADRILDFGFQECVHHILGHLPQERQTLLFSATLRASVQRLSKAALRNPEVVSVHQNAASRTPEKLKQVYMTMPVDQKVNMLFSFLRSHCFKKIIVFVSCCKQVRFFYEAFKVLKPGPSVMELHGRQSLTKRLCVFKEFTDKEKSVVLFCTDVAARGVDFPAVDWVVQADCPDSVESYIHRVGRTARYQSSGNSALFLLPSEEAFATKLAAAKIDIKSIAAKSKKTLDITQQLSGLLAGNPEIFHLAQKSFISYVRSIKLMKDKDVFDASQLDLETFAYSLGLAIAPDMGLLGGEADLEKNPLKNMKNQSSLQRLRDKIKQKKKDKQMAAEAGDTKVLEAEEAAELAADQGEVKTKRLSKWERRQQLIEKSRTQSAVPKTAAEPDDFLQPVQEEREIEAMHPVTSKRKKRLKLGNDGVAKGAAGTHTIFTGKDAVPTGGFASIAAELKADGFEGSDDDEAEGGGREAFLRNIASHLKKKDGKDVETQRTRLLEKKGRKRHKDKEERRGEDAEGGAAVAVLGGGSSASGGGSDDDAAAADSDSDSPRVFPGQHGPGRPGMRHASGSAPAAPAAPTPAPVDTSTMEGLGALEREALGRLGAGLFS